MAHVVFLRAANVGGRNVFRPAQLAAALEHLNVVNVGAAGTFVVRGKAAAASIRREIQAHLPCELEMAVIPAREIIALARSRPFEGVAFSKDLRGWIALLPRRPTKRPEVPLFKPQGKKWSVRIDRVGGWFALGVLHRRPGRFLFPNQVVEGALGVPSTTRWWETLVRVAELLER